MVYCQHHYVSTTNSTITSVLLMHDLFFLIIDILFISFFFFFNDTATTEIYTLSLHDALPICIDPASGTLTPLSGSPFPLPVSHYITTTGNYLYVDRKSTRLNSSHLVISYAVFCLKKKKTIILYCVCYIDTWCTVNITM